APQVGDTVADAIRGGDCDRGREWRRIAVGIGGGGGDECAFGDRAAEPGGEVDGTAVARGGIDGAEERFTLHVDCPHWTREELDAEGRVGTAGQGTGNGGVGAQN